MIIAPKYANQKFAGFNTMTFTKENECQHNNGWYVVVEFWIFKKRIFVCSDCGHYKNA